MRLPEATVNAGEKFEVGKVLTRDLEGWLRSSGRKSGIWTYQIAVPTFPVCFRPAGRVLGV